MTEAVTVHGYVRIITLRGDVFDMILSETFPRWISLVKSDGVALTPFAGVPWHAISSFLFSTEPFAGMAPPPSQANAPSTPAVN